MDYSNINKDDVPIAEKLEHRERIYFPLVFSMIFSWIVIRGVSYFIYTKMLGSYYIYAFHIFELIHFIFVVFLFLHLTSKWKRGEDSYLLLKLFIIFAAGFVVCVSLDVVVDNIINKRLFYVSIFSLYYSLATASLYIVVMIYFFMFFSKYLRVEDKIKNFFVPMYLKIAASIYASVMIVSTLTITVFVKSYETDQKVLLNSFSKDALISNYSIFSDYILKLDNLIYSNKQLVTKVVSSNSKIDNDMLSLFVNANLNMIDTQANKYAKSISITINSKYMAGNITTTLDIINPLKHEYIITTDNVFDEYSTDNNKELLSIYSGTYVSTSRNFNVSKNEYFDLILTSPIYLKDERIGTMQFVFDGSYIRNAFIGKISSNNSWNYMLYDVETEIVYDSTEYMLFNYNISNYFNTEEWKNFLLEIKNNRNNYFLNSINIHDKGIDYMILAIKIKTLDSAIVYMAQNNEIIVQSRNYNNINFNLTMVFIFLHIIAVLFTYFISRILRTFAKTSKYAMYMKDGKGDLRIRLDIESNDEVGGLAYNFNGFLSMLDNLIGEIKQESLHLDKEVKVMNDVITESVSVIGSQTENIKQTVSRVNAMMTSISNISMRSNEQKEVFSSVSNSINELLKTVMKINDSMTKQSASVEETSASIEEMISNINSVAKSVSNADRYSSKLLTDAKAGGYSVDEVIDAIRNIEESSDQIKDIIKVIQSIAEETNLLAMNAAIEAAHAGEHGRGFAVVADQIRALAESTANNTKTITAIIKDITKRIEKTVDIAIGSGKSLESIVTMSGSTAHIISEINIANTELEVGGRDILETVKQLNVITEQVKDNVSEQINSGDVVDNQMKILDTITSDITSTIESNTTGVKDVMETMELLNNLSERSKEANDNLFRSIERINTKFKELSKLTFNFTTKNDIIETDVAEQEKDVDIDIEKLLEGSGIVDNDNNIEERKSLE